MQRSLKIRLRGIFYEFSLDLVSGRFIFNSFDKEVDFVFICLNILKSMIRRKVDYYHFYIDLSLETNVCKREQVPKL